ncbi:MAG: hypothetical protein HGA41_00390 [Syntrophaceae bacterium]|nr:hypothetical protein [Syntrophaceae bacterium]
MLNAPQFIRIELLSDTTFSRGEGTAGVVDVEVEHDELGLPFLGGKALRGLLHDSWLSMQSCFPSLSQSYERIFGIAADMDDRAILRIGNAVVDSETRRWIEAAIYRPDDPIASDMVLQALTSIRHQTAEERTTGAPAETTLRSVRVVNRALILQATLNWLDFPTEPELRCLALALSATRHAGLGRNRGRGHIRLTFDGDTEKTIRFAKGERP